jgi:probable H4MPT-linked C1 transfer pathway protein
MAEQFASASDVYRLTGELDEHTDQLPAADGGDKTVDGSRRRLARMVGSDTGSGTGEQWLQLARYWREAQLGQIREGIEAQLSRGEIGSRAPLVGAGVGRFLVKELASRLARPYFDFSEMLGDQAVQTPFSIDDCAPAAAVAWLARRALDRR